MQSNINSQYRKNDTSRILQGDILTNFQLPLYNSLKEGFESIDFSYGVIITQDCDLNQDFNKYMDFKSKNGTEKFNESAQRSIYDKMIPSILICPGYPADQVRIGEHLNKLGFKMQSFGKISKTPWQKTIQNQNPRYHYLKSIEEFEMLDIVFDFKRYYTCEIAYIYSIYKKCYSISLNELYRENLCIRFHNFQSRIGTPND